MRGSITRVISLLILPTGYDPDTSSIDIYISYYVRNKILIKVMKMVFSPWDREI